MLWRNLLVVVLTVLIFFVTGIFASSPHILADWTGVWVALVVGVLIAGGLAATIRQYREKQRLRSEVDRLKADSQGKIWRGY
jgi:hypothetical protein